MSHWIYKDIPYLEAPEDMAGFVYVITNMLNNRKYIGKKIFWSKVTKAPLKGKTRKRRSVKDSGWGSYTSSSKYVNEAIEEFGIDNFKFEILSIHESRGEINYNELRCQILNDVLEARLDNGDRAYYNENIALRFYNSEKYNEERISIKSSLLIE